MGAKEERKLQYSRPLTGNMHFAATALHLFVLYFKEGSKRQDNVVIKIFF